MRVGFKVGLGVGSDTVGSFVGQDVKVGRRFVGFADGYLVGYAVGLADGVTLL